MVSDLVLFKLGARQAAGAEPCVVYAVALNANRLVTGVLRGFDQFMNIVLDNTVDEKSHTDIGMVVSYSASD